MNTKDIQKRERAKIRHMKAVRAGKEKPADIQCVCQDGIWIAKVFFTPYKSYGWYPWKKQPRLKTIEMMKKIARKR